MPDLAANPGVRRYFEDIVEGQTVDLGTVQVSASEIVAFGRQFDSQPFHVDEAAGRASIYGGLIASGWHTAALFMRLFAERVLNSYESLGSPGVDQLRWLRPVRPGDTLRARWTAVECRASQSKPDRGIVRSRSEVFNQQDELVMTIEAVNFFARRP
jgi:acyl dehydratase